MSKLIIHKQASVDVLSYEALVIGNAIKLLFEQGVPEGAALEVTRVGDYEFPRTIVKASWSTWVEASLD